MSHAVRDSTPKSGVSGIHHAVAKLYDKKDYHKWKRTLASYAYTQSVSDLLTAPLEQRVLEAIFDCHRAVPEIASFFDGDSNSSDDESGAGQKGAHSTVKDESGVSSSHAVSFKHSKFLETHKNFIGAPVPQDLEEKAGGSPYTQAGKPARDVADRAAVKNLWFHLEDVITKFSPEQRQMLKAVKQAETETRLVEVVEAYARHPTPKSQTILSLAPSPRPSSR